MTDRESAPDQELAPVFPLGSAFLPGDVVSLRVFEPRYRQLMNELPLWGDKFVSLLIAEGSEVGGNDRRFDTGVMVENLAVFADGDLFIVQGVATRIVEIVSWLPDNPYPIAAIAEQEVSVEASVVSSSDVRHALAVRLSKVAQRTRTLRAMVARGANEEPDAQTGALGTIAAGQWTHDDVSAEQLWSALWAVARAVPCGSLDRYRFLTDGLLSDRVGRLETTVEHVTEIVRFRWG